MKFTLELFKKKQEPINVKEFIEKYDIQIVESVLDDGTTINFFKIPLGSTTYTDKNGKIFKSSTTKFSSKMMKKFAKAYIEEKFK